jgi:hypothetical protein
VRNNPAAFVEIMDVDAQPLVVGYTDPEVITLKEFLERLSTTA